MTIFGISSTFVTKFNSLFSCKAHRDTILATFYVFAVSMIGSLFVCVFVLKVMPFDWYGVKEQDQNVSHIDVPILIEFKLND